ncbi:protein odr-4 homolog isoform X2 [Antedon mediterranea]
MMLVPTPSPDGGDSNTEVIDDQWLAQHSIQVSRMMLGGMKVIGVFVICTTSELLKKIQPKLRQAVFAIHKHMKRKQIIELEDRVTDRILLQVSSVGQTKSITCRSIDVADPNSTLKHADWKYQSSISCNIATTQLQVDLTIPLTVQTGKSALRRDLNNGLVPFLNSVKQAMATIDQQIKSGEELFESRSSKPKSGKKAAVTIPAVHTHTLELFAKKVCDNYEVTKSNCVASLRLSGCIECRAYLNSKATVDDAIQALKEDAIRSMQARCDLLVDELAQDQDDAEGFNRITILPTRVFSSMPDVSIDVCDYMFPDESAMDCIERFSEILGVAVTEDMLDMESEPLPDTDSLKQEADPSAKEVPTEMSDSTPEASPSKRGQYIAAAVSMSGALIAALMSYLTLSND